MNILDIMASFNHLPLLELLLVSGLSSTLGEEPFAILVKAPGAGISEPGKKGSYMHSFVVAFFQLAINKQKHCILQTYLAIRVTTSLSSMVFLPAC